MNDQTPSTLGFALLALLYQQSRSGYDLRKVFATTPMMHFSDSPGTIYAALQRLRRNGWICPTPAHSAEPRRKQIFKITARGLKELKRWLERPITSSDVIWSVHELMLRFAFMGEILGRKAVIRFSKCLEKELNDHTLRLKTYYASSVSGMSLTGRLALACGIEVYRSRARWARRAAARLAHENEG